MCQGASVLLQANTGIGLSYQWQRDGVDIPGATDDSLRAAVAGNYTVRVSGLACTAATSIPVTVTVNPLPAQPDFQPNPNTAQCAGSPITFSISSPQPGESYVWDFGDGTTATGNPVSHTYADKGSGTVNREVKVYSVGPGGCLSPERSRLVAVQRSPDFSAPTDSAGFKVCIPDTVTDIKASAVLYNTTPPGPDIVSYEVDFGDGSGVQTFLASQFTATTPIRNPVPYDTTGAFPITIRALGSNGCVTVFTKNYEVNKKPEAKFSASKDRVEPRVPPKDCIPVKVTVDSDSTTGGVVRYKWSVKSNTGQDAGPGIFQFLDNTNDSSASPVMQFDVPGRYNLELIVTNACGADTTSQSLLIGYPEVRLNADTTSCGPAVVNFSDQRVQIDPNLGTIEEASIEWTITGTSGAVAVNGTTLKDRFPQIRFPNPGTYEVRLRLRNECGFSDAVAQQAAISRITVNPIPAAPTVSGTGLTLCAGDTTSIRPTGPGNSFSFYQAATGGTALFTGRAYNPGPLTATATYYVATRDAKGCESSTRRAFTLTVVPAIANNVISQTEAQKEVCAGQTLSQALTGQVPTGGQGSPLYTWQSSETGNPGDFRPATGTNTGKDFRPGTLARTTYFRRLVTIGDCRTDTSNVVVVQVNPPIANNTINLVGGGGVICEDQPAPLITGSQPQGRVQILYESSTSGANATDFRPAAGFNTGADYDPGVLDRTTWFRRRLSSGGCTDVSAAVEIRVNPSVTSNSITGDQNVCDSQTLPKPIIGSIPRGGSGTVVYLWEISLTGNEGDYTPAPGTNNQPNYQPPAISRDTWLRRSVSSEACEPVPSNDVKLTFVPAVDNNIITVNQTSFCAGGIPEFTGSAGNRSLVFLWEASTVGPTTGFNPAPGDNDGRNYRPESFNTSTWYRRQVRAAGTDCPPTSSNVIAVTFEPIPAAPLVEAGEVRVCQGQPATLRVRGNNAATYEWYTSPAGGTPVFYGPEFVTAPLLANTSYYVQTVSANACASATRSQVRVQVAAISADAGRDTTIMEGKFLALRARGGTRYRWTPAAGLSNDTIANPVASPSRTTTYRVEVRNELGCLASDEVTITVTPRVKVVNTFSPNQDGINETWEIENIGLFPNATVEVFNRWGNPVFKSSGPYQPWDGTFKGSPLPLATYYYIIRLDKDEKPLSGSVTLIR
ncbi:MAG: PKD domain-containing protein [Adhaeribacter sp.]